MTSQHTPGPWTYHYEPTLNRHVVRAGFAGERGICSTYGAVAKSYECAANARLIAEAPSTLAALEQLLDVMEPPRSRKASEAWDAAHAAVRRARAVAD